MIDNFDTVYLCCVGRNNNRSADAIAKTAVTWLATPGTTNQEILDKFDAGITLMKYRIVGRFGHHALTNLPLTYVSYVELIEVTNENIDQDDWIDSPIGWTEFETELRQRIADY